MGLLPMIQDNTVHTFLSSVLIDAHVLVNKLVLYSPK